MPYPKFLKFSSFNPISFSFKYNSKFCKLIGNYFVTFLIYLIDPKLLPDKLSFK